MSFKSSFFKINYLTSLGTRDITDEQRRKAIQITNSLALITAFLAAIIGTVFSILTGKWSIFIPAIIESAAFLGIVYMNFLGKHQAAGLSLLILHSICAVYFGVHLGMLVEIRLIILFMVSATLLIYNERKPIIICITATALCLILMEANYFLQIVQPIPLSYNMQFFLRWLCILSILILNIVVIAFYKHNNALLYNALQEQNALLEDQVQERTKQLREANVLKERYIRQTNHEIRNPLNAIFSIAQIMKQDLMKKGMKPDITLIEPLYAASFNAREIINNVLEISKIEAGILHTIDKTDFKIRAFMLEQIAIYKFLAHAKSVYIQYDFDSRLPQTMYADRLKLGQIFGNILSNAIKFTAPDTVVSVKAIWKSSNEWQFCISDKGAGIAQDKIKTIFEPFTSEKNTFTPGTGLGLSISQHFVELFEGRIEVYSEVGEGTNFLITLPLEIGNSRHVEKEVKNLSYEQQTILLIDDDVMSTALISHILSDLGLEVLKAKDSITGLALARAERPDMILLDGHLDVSGLEVLQQLKEDTVLQKVPVIIVSGDAFTDTKTKYRDAGAVAYVTKPVLMQELQEVVEEHLIQNRSTSVERETEIDPLS
jgi:signal transduction histidine kinase/CheY-like chemotaxis protein